ncbi:hypothetical protein EC973_007415 [Apophysomyces ossiformis]|uniref:Aminodeoxychorismate lyase n=1 Tax=Apophysomyces ossiformis TaxID=679940 RepID=A0A8H7BTZ3_9FUNG|nr:hypothetical protein EC973_007415 [Apophysomyces ossiformis]
MEDEADGNPEGFYLLDLHIARLLKAAQDFHAANEDIFPNVPTAHELIEALNNHVATTTTTTTEPSPLPLRVRLLLDLDGKVNIEHTELSGSGGYELLDAAAAADDAKLINVILDSQPIPCPDDPFLLHKTTRREVYEAARQRTGCDWHPEKDEPFDVVLWNTERQVTETSIANIAVRMKTNECWLWKTPRLDCGLLPGTFREWLIQDKQVEEGIITVDDLIHAQKHGDPIICFNSVRKAYPVRLLIRSNHSTEEGV